MSEVNALSRLLLTVFPLCFVSLGNAAIFNCKDANGRQIFSDEPCGSDAKTVNVNPASGTSVVDPSTNTRVEYYDVSGMTSVELWGNIRRNGPAGWSGVTNSTLSYQFKSKPIPNGCKLETIHVDADMVVRLPRWLDQYKAPIELRNQWEDSIRRLDLHERGHVNISVDAAQRIERAFRNITTAHDCSEFENAARAQASQILQQYKDRQIDYDKRTNHGLNQ